MNTDNGALSFDAWINNTDFKRQIDEMNNRIRGLSDSTTRETKKMDDAFSGIGKTVMALGGTAVLTGFASQLINIRGEFQKLDVAFTTMLGSKEKANALMGQIVETAAKTPFTLTEVANGAKQLLAYQVEAEKVNETVIRLGNISAGVGVPLGQLVAVYGQVKAKGRLMGDDMRQFMNAGIPIVSELAKVMGVADKEVQQLVTDGKVGFSEVQKVIEKLTDKGGMFFNLMEDQSKTLSGQLSNLQDAWERMFNKIGEGSEGLLSGMIGGATFAVDHYQEILDIVTPLVAAYGTYKAALLTTIAVQKASAALTFAKEYLAMGKALGFATANQIAFNKATLANPYTLALAAVVGLSLAIYNLAKNTSDLSEGQERIAKASQQASEEFAVQKNKIDLLRETAKNQALTDGQRLEAIKQLKEIMPGYNAEISNEGKLVNESTLAIEAYLKQLELKIKMTAVQDEMAELWRREREEIKKLEQATNEYNQTKARNALPDVIGGGDTGIAGAVVKITDTAMSENAMNKAQDQLEKTRSAIAELKGEFNDAEKSLSDFLSGDGDKSKSTVEQQIKDIQKRLQDAKASLAGMRLLSSVASPEDIENQEKIIKDLEKELQLLTGVKAAQDAKNDKDFDKDRLEVLKKANDAEIALLRSQIQDKKALIDFDLKQELAAIDEMEKVYLEKAKLAGVRNPDMGVFSTLRKTATTQADQDKQAIDVQDYEDLLKNYQTFEQKMKAVVDDFEEKKTTARKHGNEELLKELDKAEQKALLELTSRELGAWKDLFASLEGLRKKDLISRLALVDAQLAKEKEGSEAYIELAKQRTLIDSTIKGKTSNTYEDIAEAGRLMSQAGDEISQAIGGMVTALAEMAATISDPKASGFQKASGIISLVITAGNYMKQAFDEYSNRALDDQIALNEQLAYQLTLEASINEKRREREDRERNSSAFLDPSFGDEFKASLKLMKDSEKTLNDSVEDLFGNAVFSAKGKAKRKLFGTKSDTYSFSMKDIIAGTEPEKSGFSLGLFDIGYADSKAKKNAFGKLEEAFNSTLKAMGKTSADMATMSATEWVDFYSLMQEGGYITDEGTKKMVETAKAAAEDYAKAMEQMKDIINDVAGSLGDSLSSSLVSAFENGTDAAEAFKKSVNDVLKSIFMSNLQNMLFKKYFDKLQEEMTASMDGGDENWSDDIQRFFTDIAPALGIATEAMDAFNKKMEEEGYEGFGSSASKGQGLSGSIKGVSEETASLLSGYINAMRINQIEQVDLTRQQLFHLSEIAANTRYNAYMHASLKSIDSRLAAMGSNDFRAVGL